jgi:hypothetical protein
LVHGSSLSGLGVDRDGHPFFSHFIFAYSHSSLHFLSPIGYNGLYFSSQKLKLTGCVVGAVVIGDVVVDFVFGGVVVDFVFGGVVIDFVFGGVVVDFVFGGVGRKPSFIDTLSIKKDNESTANIIKTNENAVILIFILLYYIQGKIILSKNKV